MQFLEDLEVGNVKRSPASFTITAEDIKNFAQQWDPMPFHLDEKVAEQTPMGKLFASSIHTIAAGIRMSYDLMDEEVAAMAGLGWTDVKFPKPVFAGDSIRMESEIIEKRESKTKPDRGIIITHNRIYNQHDEMVAEYKITTMVMRRPQ